jgi:FkbM family methyltransferase
MSRFQKLRSHLSFSEALKIYTRLKTKNLSNIRLSKLKHPFTLRTNPYDYYTFLEVVLQEAYNVAIDFTPSSIIDGGGNIGLTAAYFASRYPDAKILTIEPDKENFELLKQNTGAYKNIEQLNGGIWDHAAHLLVKDLGIGNNGFMVEETSEGTAGAIQSWGIYDLMQKMNWPTCDIVKLDVEGSEKEIFSANYQQWLPKTKLLIVEVHDRMKKGCSKAVFTAINQYNFSMNVAGENLVFRNEDLQ